MTLDPIWGDGIRFVVEPMVARSAPLMLQDESGLTLYVHPYDWLAQLYKGKLPLYTRHTLGAREAERDRRRYR